MDGGWSVDELLLLPVQRFVEGGGQVFGQEDLQSLAGCHWGVAGHGEGPGHGIDEDAQRGLDIGRLELEKVRIKHSLVGGKRGCLALLPGANTSPPMSWLPRSNPRRRSSSAPRKAGSTFAWPVENMVERGKGGKMG